MEMQLDPWQVKVMETKGNMVLRSGRQVGKSFIIAKKAAEYAMKNEKKLIMVIAFTEKQANLLFSKILHNIVMEEKFSKRKLIAKPKPTKHVINLKNGSEIYCYAAGDTGYGIMGYTIDLLIADEAAWIKEEVWNSIVPALAVTQGTMWLLSTPFIKEGFYFDCFDDDAFTSFHQSSEDCPRITEEFLDRMKKRFTSQQYEQMYKGEFVDGFRRVFTDDWIERVCVLEPVNRKPISDNTALGVDIAALGEDESTFEGLERIGDMLTQFHHEITEKTLPTQTEDKIIDLNVILDFWRIGIDSGGMGIGVLAHLLREDSTKRKVVGLDNSKREIDADGKEKIMKKEAMYYNLKEMGERGQLQLFDTPEIRASLRSIQIEENGKINGRYAHIAEGLIRAAELLKEKELNIKVYSIPVR